MEATYESRSSKEQDMTITTTTIETNARLYESDVLSSYVLFETQAVNIVEEVISV